MVIQATRLCQRTSSGNTVKSWKPSGGITVGGVSSVNSCVRMSYPMRQRLSGWEGRAFYVVCPGEGQRSEAPSRESGMGEEAILQLNVHQVQSGVESGVPQGSDDSDLGAWH